jgi:hypothetical protein
MNNGIQVEKGIAIPAMRGNEGNAYPYGEMKVGDSFMVTGGTKSLINAVCARNKKAGVEWSMTFTAKKVEGGVRVWRVG